MGSHSLLQGTVQTQGSNSGLLQCRPVLYQKPRGKPNITSTLCQSLDPQLLSVQTEFPETQERAKVEEIPGRQNLCRYRCGDEGQREPAGLGTHQSALLVESALGGEGSRRGREAGLERRGSCAMIWSLSLLRLSTRQRERAKCDPICPRKDG